jgi:hypothetical protein
LMHDLSTRSHFQSMHLSRWSNWGKKRPSAPPTYGYARISGSTYFSGGSYLTCPQ